MIIETRAVAPFYKNGFVVGCEKTREGIVIDPGDEVELLLGAARDHGLAIRYILLTHAHLDHVTGVSVARRALHVPVGLHSADNFLYEGVVQQGMMFGLKVEPQPEVDFFYDQGRDKLQFGKYGVSALHTPGHCPGGVCLAVGRLREGSEGPDHTADEERVLFVGDTLFAGSIGRTDLPGGDMETLLRSIREVIFRFPDATVVHPGHGEPTTVGRERASNPFLA